VEKRHLSKLICCGKPDLNISIGVVSEAPAV